jgi:hypothetical protein
MISAMDSETTSGRVRVRVGKNRYEDATVTLRFLRVIIKFDSEDLDDIEVDLGVLNVQLPEV